MGELSLANHSHSGYAASNHTHIEYASSSHNHSTSEITSGTLPLARGGTGVTSISALKTALGISSSGSIRPGSASKYFSIESSSQTATGTISSGATVIIGIGNGGLLELIGYKSGTSWTFIKNQMSIQTYGKVSIAISGTTITYTCTGRKSEGESGTVYLLWW